MRKVLLLLFVSISALPVFGQFSLSGEFRPKIEFRDGYKTLRDEDQSPAFVTAQRSRLNFMFQDKRIATRFSVQDVRIWGESPSKTDASSVNVFEAWAEVFLNESLSFRFGRQELSFDQNRLLGASNWNDVGASHDLMQLRFHKNFDFQAGFAYNNDKTKNFESNYPVSFYKTMIFLRGEKNLGKYLNASAIFIADGNQKDESDHVIYQRITYGGNLLFRNDSVKHKIYGTFYLQNGTSPTGTSINAHFMALNYEYAFTKSFSGILGVDYFSGDDAFSDDDKKNSFNNLYGNTHNYYGYMDYFQQIDKDTKGGGLMDLYVRANVKMTKKTTGELTYHYFSFTNDVMDTITSPGLIKKADRYLGSEIDVTLKYKVASNIELSCGYSAMLASPVMEMIKGGDHTKTHQWAWFMLTFKPEFISKNKNN